MADALTRVLTTRHTGAAWLATRDSFDVTRKVLSLLMAPVAGFHSEGCARRAMLLAVAAVGDRMVASVRAVADPGTFRRSNKPFIIALWTELTVFVPTHHHHNAIWHHD